MTAPLFSQRPERTLGDHTPETRRGLRKDEVNDNTKRRRRHFERRSRRRGPPRRRKLPYPERPSRPSRPDQKAQRVRRRPNRVRGDGRSSDGAYHRLFQHALDAAGLPWVKVNPRQARRFAQAAGKLAKTDRCDALILARMGAALGLEPSAPLSQTVEAMKELVNARDALVKDRVAALNRQAITVSPLIKRQLAQRLRQVDSQIEAINKRLKSLRGADPDLGRRFDILVSIPGVGETTARVSRTLMGETPKPRASARPCRRRRCSLLALTGGQAQAKSRRPRSIIRPGRRTRTSATAATSSSPPTAASSSTARSRRPAGARCGRRRPAELGQRRLMPAS